MLRYAESMRFSRGAGTRTSTLLALLAAHATALVAACSGDASLAADDDSVSLDASSSDATDARSSDASDANHVQDADAQIGVPDASDAEASDADTSDASDAEASDASDASASDAADASDASDADASDAGDAGPVEPPAPLSLIRLEGRWDRSLPDAPRTAYPGARLLLKFTGTGVRLRLLERKSFRSALGTSQYDVSIDGAAPLKLTTSVAIDLQEETEDYVLASELPAGVHVVEVVRRTEAEFGSTRLVGVMVEGGAMLAPPARLDKRIEFVGDSNMTGYGVEATRPCTHNPDHQNWSKAFPALVAARFLAEVEAVAYSGKGVYYNSNRADLDVMGVLYPPSIPTDPLSLYDAAQFPADAVVVLVGGNDFAQRVGGDYPTEEQVHDAYAALIEQIHGAHPGALITCMISPGINDSYPTYPVGDPAEGQSVMVRSKVKAAITSVVDARALAGWNIVFHDVGAADNSDLSACDFHPSAALHVSLATGLGDLLQTKLGW